MCVQQYNNSSTAVQHKKTKAKKQGQGDLNYEVTCCRVGYLNCLTLCLSRIERSTAEPKGNVTM